MAEPSNSDTVAEHDKTPSKPVATKPAAPVKASPLQKSFLERRKARETAGAAAAGTMSGAKKSGASASAKRDGAAESASISGRVDLQKSAVGREVRRAGADQGRIRQVGLRILAGVALVAVIAAAVLFGVGKHQYDRKNELRAEYSSFAQQVTVNLTTLTPSNVGQLQKTLLEQTSGYAKQQMEQAVKQTVELVKQGQLSTKTTVLSTAVTRADADRGSAIMVFGWTSKPNDPKQEMAVETYRWRVDMTRINGQLKLTNFEWVW
ncbi:hypothetical protein HH308_26240 [Gordonia sp. TBRC 11910]|uniref:Mce-associated membrane protein n=1 Tax=Gordonia asplenii TaxID=2725283 RepID=A0A848L2K8_9ACTN|nr:hypothetical protein [Gordonia asplenii]NMO04727.1 hypothetical protein [Gordonia asplenii]